MTFVNEATTGKAGSKPSVDYSDDKLNPDGTRTVTLTGSFPADGKPVMASFAVPEPSRFAATVFMEALKDQGISARLAAPAEQMDFKALAKNYTAENMVAEHVSPPLKEEVKITLKVSQNAACQLDAVSSGVTRRSQRRGH